MVRRGVLTLVLMLLSAAVSLLPARVRRIICVEPMWTPISEVAPLLESVPRTDSMVLMVVDTSGSARNLYENGQLEMLYQRLGGAATVGVVTYADSAKRVARPGKDATRLLGTLPLRGGSNLVAGLEEALDWFAQAGSGGRIALVSDGAMNVGVVDASALVGIGAAARARGVVIDSYLIDRPEGTLLEDLSEATYGVSQFLPGAR